MVDFQIQDITIMAIFLFAFIYFVIYRKNRFFGNIGFLGVSILIMSFGTTYEYKVVGFIMLLGSIVSLVYDITNKWTNK